MTGLLALSPLRTLPLVSERDTGGDASDGVSPALPAALLGSAAVIGTATVTNSPRDSTSISAVTSGAGSGSSLGIAGNDSDCDGGSSPKALAGVSMLS